MAKKKKKPAAKKGGQKKKKLSAAKLTAGIAAAAAIIALVVFLVMMPKEDKSAYSLKNTEWQSVSAVNASGDEVDIREVYNVKYSNYQGRLTFDDSGRFELWLSPGDAAGGDHSGTYTLKDDVISAVFDNGAAVDFGVRRKGGTVTQIDVAYEAYTVSFFPA